MEREADKLDADPVRTVKNRLSEVRGLAFIADVPVVLETKESLTKDLRADLEAHRSEKTRSDQSLAYAKLGLLPRGADLERTFFNYYSPQVQGFYDSTTKKIFLLDRRNSSAGADFLPSQNAEEFDASVLVHELTHALQDQHFSLGRKLRSPENGDRALALTAVAEADALLTEHAYRFGGLQEWLPAYVRQVLQSGVGNSESSAVPAVIADKIRFEYLSGLDFVSRAVSKLGWRSLNRIYEHPPLSTEQILHPKKYFSRPDPPMQIRLKNTAALFSAEWSKVENDTLGELMVRCLFEQFIRRKKAALVASGWDGDRFVAFRKGAEVAFIWATTWDSSRDAGEFFNGYRTIVPMKYDMRSFERDHFYIEKRDRTVLIIEGLSHRYVKQRIDSIWHAMEMKEAAFQPPPPLKSLTAIR